MGKNIGFKIRRKLDQPEIRKCVLALHGTTDLKSLWDAFSRLMRALLTVREINFAVSLDRGRPSMSFSATLDHFSPEMWESSYHASGLPEVEAAAPGRKALRMTDWMPPELRHSAEQKFREDYLSREQLFYAAVIAIWRGRSFAHLFGIARSFDQGDFSDEEMALLEALHPDLETALWRVLKTERQLGEISALSRSLREERRPLLVLDWKLRPTFRNPEAMEASRHWDAGARKRPRLKTNATKALPPRLEQACQALREEVTRDGWHNLDVIRRPLTRRHRLSDHGSPEAEIIYCKPGNAPVDEGRFIVRFGTVLPGSTGEPSAGLDRLTVSEEAVVELVGDGRSNDEVATALGLSVHTVRAHLRSIFPKLGVQSRAQLASQLHRARNA